MEAEIDWLDRQISRMQADMSLGLHVPGLAFEPNSKSVNILRMAAQLNGSNPDRTSIDPAFKLKLLGIVKEACASEGQQ